MLVSLLQFFIDERGVTSLEAALILAVIAVACTDVLISRGPNTSGEISQILRR